MRCHRTRTQLSKVLSIQGPGSYLFEKRITMGNMRQTTQHVRMRVRRFVRIMIPGYEKWLGPRSPHARRKTL
jgi:hypothetical protein